MPTPLSHDRRGFLTRVIGSVQAAIGGTVAFMVGGAISAPFHRRDDNWLAAATLGELIPGEPTPVILRVVHDARRELAARVDQRSKQTGHCCLDACLQRTAVGSRNHRDLALPLAPEMSEVGERCLPGEFLTAAAKSSERWGCASPECARITCKPSIHAVQKIGMGRALPPGV